MGKPVLSRVGVIVKCKGNKTKVRLVHDLSRSGVNHLIRLPERIVLPRLSDIIDAARDLLAQRSATQGVGLMVLDFKDAFKQLHVHPDEQRFLTGAYSDGCFAYSRVLFGVVTGPLVWGRVAACWDYRTGGTGGGKRVYLPKWGWGIPS